MPPGGGTSRPAAPAAQTAAIEAAAERLLQLRWRRWIPTTTMLWVRVQVALQMPHAVVIPVLDLAAWPSATTTLAGGRRFCPS